MKTKGCIVVEACDEALARALADTLSVEARSPPDPEKGKTSVSVEGRQVIVCFEAQSVSAARAILNAFLSLAAATGDTVASLGGEGE